MNKLISLLSIIILFFICNPGYSQEDNIPLSNPVYDYLKIMSVKQVIGTINDDDPNLSRQNVRDFLYEIDSKSDELSKVERQLLAKYKLEFLPEERTSENTTQFFDGDGKFSKRVKDIFSDKKKYIYTYEKDENNLYVDLFGNLVFAKEFKPYSDSVSYLFDGGFRFQGTVFNHLGYNLMFQKGAISKSPTLAIRVDPRLKNDYKFLENYDNIQSYDFNGGYLRYKTSPMEGMDISAQIGREQLKFGFGYGERLALSGNGPDMDFIKFNFKYGIINFTSITASTVGEFHRDLDSNYSKYWAANMLKLSFPKLFDIGMGDMVIYSRPLDLGYLNPLIFYKFVEHSLQDRDNGLIFFDFQTHFLKNIQFQANFLMDEDFIGQLSNLNRYSNKIGYQLGTYLYEPANIRNLSLIFEYTKIRPFVYTHVNPKNTYTSYTEILGNSIGPNADQLSINAIYNFSDRLQLNLLFKKIRKGNNILDANGNLVKNVGGDVFQTYRYDIDPEDMYFLDGERVNTNVYAMDLKYEPITGFNFHLVYNYIGMSNITKDTFSDVSFAYLKFNLEY
ncbi:MAG: hypothetical protein JST55_03630 [Bacteroidetes bacterium]|nr:hypothetical protein [Bacteroidota bacterium]